MWKAGEWLLTLASNAEIRNILSHTLLTGNEKTVWYGGHSWLNVKDLCLNLSSRPSLAMRYVGQDIHPFVNFMCLPHLTHKALAGISAGNQTIVFIMKNTWKSSVTSLKTFITVILGMFSHACILTELSAEITLSGTSYLKIVNVSKRKGKIC